MSETNEREEKQGRQAAWWRSVVILLVGLGVVVSACGFIVSETERVVVLRFGKPVRTLERPGFYPRFPMPVERLVRVDSRLHHGGIRLSETLTSDQRNVIVPMIYTWRVGDVLKFHMAVGGKQEAERKLDGIVTSARNSVLGRHDFAELVGAVEDGGQWRKIEEEILHLAKDAAAEQVGVDFGWVGITRIQLPEANTEAVFRRMRAERKREATKFRAEGRAQAAVMKAETDREATRLIAEAKREAEEIRGEAEAKAAALYAEAHGSDPEFYRFLRELQSLRTIVDKNTTLVLDTSVAPLHWLKRVDPGTGPAPSRSEETDDAEEKAKPSVTQALPALLEERGE